MDASESMVDHMLSDEYQERFTAALERRVESRARKRLEKMCGADAGEQPRSGGFE
jgi:hypothetical protein